MTLSAASISFGLFTANKPVATSVDITFTSQHDGSFGCSLAVTGVGPGFTIEPSDSTIGLSTEGSTDTVSLTLDGGRSVGTGDFEGDLMLTCAEGTPQETVLRAPWWFRVERMSGNSQGSPVSAVGGEAASGLSLTWAEIALIVVAPTALALGLVAGMRRRR